MSYEPTAAKPTLTRWRWQAISDNRTYTLRLDDLHLAANPDRFPYLEGHQLTLEWSDNFYPEQLGRINSIERFLPQEDFRYERRAHLAGPFWTERITSDLRVDVSVGRPSELYGDDPSEDTVIHVGYRAGGFAWIVTRVQQTGQSIVLPTTVSA